MKKKKADRYRRAQGRKIREEGKREGWREIGKKGETEASEKGGGGRNLGWHRPNEQNSRLDRKKHVNEHSTIREAEKLQEA